RLDRRGAAGDHHDAGLPVHTAGGRAAQGDPRDPPGSQRGAPAAHPAGPVHGDAPGRGTADRTLPGAVRGPQGAARPRVPRLVIHLTPEQHVFVTERHLATLTTLRPDGTPHVVPVGFTWDPAAGVLRITT